MQNVNYVVNSHYIDGEWVENSSDKSSAVTDTNTDARIGQVPIGSMAEVDTAVLAAKNAFKKWSLMPPEERAVYLRQIARGLERAKPEMAELIEREVGAPPGLSFGPQTDAPIFNFDTAADLAESFNYTARVESSVVTREPVGVVGAITAWNFPLHLATLKVAYALAAGNTVVLKPSEVAPLTVAKLCEIVDEVGLPSGVFNVVFGEGAEVGEAIVSHPDVKMITFTGSTRAGRRIGEVASQQVKRVALELGGKSPLVVVDGADLDGAVTFWLNDLMINNGQRCDALTRIVVPRSKLAEVEQMAGAIVAQWKTGPSTEESTDIGPMASERQQKGVLDYIRIGIEEGAKVVTGGHDAPVLDGDLGNGYFVPPTLFSNVSSSMRIAQEEIFGPVGIIQPYDTLEEAIEIANSTIYGLHASVWAASSDEATSVARHLDSGMVTINSGSPSMLAPFGGYKQSGLGREYGEFGFGEFLETKALHY